MIQILNHIELTYFGPIKLVSAIPCSVCVSKIVGSLWPIWKDQVLGDTKKWHQNLPQETPGNISVLWLGAGFVWKWCHIVSKLYQSMMIEIPLNTFQHNYHLWSSKADCSSSRYQDTSNCQNLSRFTEASYICRLSHNHCCFLQFIFIYYNILYYNHEISLWWHSLVIFEHQLLDYR